MNGFQSLNRLEALVLFVGDAVVLYASLFVALFLRNFEAPTLGVWNQHVAPFSILFIVWVVSFFVAGLYDKHTTILKSRLPAIVLNTQLINSGIAILFFYLIPYFGITPKTTLFIYLVVSFVFVVLWRRYLVFFVSSRKQQPAILIGSGSEMRELLNEVNDNTRYGIHFVASIELERTENIDFKKDIIDRIYSEGISIVVIDAKNEHVLPILPRLYNLIFSRVQFVDMHKVYEDIFDRVPLSLVQHSWFLENISVTRKFAYEFLKRLMDIVIALPLFITSLPLYPIVYVAQQVEGRGPLFYIANRVGKNNLHIPIVKFRTMTGVDYDKPELRTDHRVTRVGSFLRKARIDEVPQLWNVLRGDLSLIGPRPEFPSLVEHYNDEISYYNVRHLIKPGISGWGVIHDDDVPREKADVDKTRRKLSYDLYYIKNRSFLLDLEIALKTLRRVLLQTGK